MKEITKNKVGNQGKMDICNLWGTKGPSQPSPAVPVKIPCSLLAPWQNLFCRGANITLSCPGSGDSTLLTPLHPFLILVFLLGDAFKP